MTTSKRIAKKRQPHDLSGQSFAFFGSFSYWPSYHPGPPEEVARWLGATVREEVDESLNYLVLGDKRGPGRSEAKKKAEKLQAKAKKIGKGTPCPEVLDEAAFREMVRMDVSGKSFALFGGFDCCGGGFDEGLLTRMVEAVG